MGDPTADSEWVGPLYGTLNLQLSRGGGLRESTFGIIKMIKCHWDTRRLGSRAFNCLFPYNN